MRNCSLAVGPGLSGLFRREVRVFHDAHAPVFIFCKYADLLAGTGFGEPLAGDIGPSKHMEPDKHRVDDFHQRVVHLEVRNGFYAPRRQFVDNSRCPEGREASSVTVGILEYPVLLLEDEFSMGVQGGNHVLGKYEEVAPSDSEIAVLLQERDGGLVVSYGSHYQPGNGDAVLFRVFHYFLGMHLEQRFPRNRTDGEHALGPVVAEPGALPPRHHESGGLSPSDVILSRPARPVEFPAPGVGCRKGNIRRRGEIRAWSCGSRVSADRRSRRSKSTEEKVFKQDCFSPSDSSFQCANTWSCPRR